MAKKASKKWILGLIFVAVLGAIFGYLTPHTLASSFMPLPSTEDLSIPAPEGETAIEKFENFLGPVARNLRIIIGAIAVLLIVIAGFSMVISGENEEDVKKHRRVITYSVIGLIMISIAGPVAEIFDYRRGNFMDNPEDFIERAQLFDSMTQMVITFLKYLLGSLATLMFVRSGAIMVMSSDNEEEITREKKNLFLGVAGLFLVIVSDLIISKILYNAEYNDATNSTRVAIDQNELVRQLVGIVNLMVSFVGPIMMLGIVAGGVLYVTSGGDDERTGLAKKIIKNSIIGVVIIYSAFALVSTVIAGYF
ncbi:MAG: hypothetical protein WC897_00370 [Candidatus Gracilibacteria bacterium]